MADSSSKEEEVAGSIPPRRRSVLQRVPVALRENEKHIYDPVAVPLGPYHHGRRPEFHLAEQLKEEVLDMVCGDPDTRALMLRLVSERLPEIRQFYGGADRYGDEELAAMMLRDTCFVLHYLKTKEFSVFNERIGVYGTSLVKRDLFLLENQIPLWLMSLLTPFVCGDSHGLELLLLNFLLRRISCNAETTRATLKWGSDRQLPLHLLEASHRLLLPFPDHDSDPHLITTHKPPPPPQYFNNMYRSATDLKAKGIHFRPSSESLRDISFFSFSTYGRLHLPMFRIPTNSKLFLSNLVAYELMSDGRVELGIIRYIGLMKTLLRRAEDVELLRDKGILYSFLSNEEVVRLFQDIDTYGTYNPNIFNDVKKRIEEHCSNKGKTCLAELINTYFRSPLTVVALFAATFILALTFLQTFYTIKS